MKNGKLILIGYVAFFVLLLYFSIRFAETILAIRVIDMADTMVFSVVPLPNLLGLILAGGITFWLWNGRTWWGEKGKRKRFREELDKAIDELKKVHWPSKEEAKVTTISVFVFVFVMMAVFIVFDLVWSNLLRFI